MKYILSTLGILGVLTLSLSLLSLDTIKNASPTQPKAKTTLIKGINPNKDYFFSGEKVPVHNLDVRERLERELLSNSYANATIILNLKHANRYFPTIERILAENNIPEDFKYLAVAESNFRQGTSSAGAKGFWQFMPSTAKGYGLEVNSNIDERMNLEKATYAACRLLQDYKNKFGTWTLAAAAYNIGEGKLQDELRSQRVDSYYDLNLYQETLRYLFRVMAFKEIMSHPEDYGYNLNSEDMYLPLNDILDQKQVNNSISNLVEFAKENGTTLRQLRVYNPWLLGNSLENSSGKVYVIKYPKVG
jgi:membrane-bound lytic murein transglycosylase D